MLPNIFSSWILSRKATFLTLEKWLKKQGLKKILVEPETGVKPKTKRTSLKDIEKLYEDLRSQVDDTHNSIRNEHQDLRKQINESQEHFKTEIKNLISQLLGNRTQESSEDEQEDEGLNLNCRQVGQPAPVVPGHKQRDLKT